MTESITARGIENNTRALQTASQTGHRRPVVDSAAPIHQAKPEDLVSAVGRTEVIDALAEVSAEIDQAMSVLNETLAIGPTSASISKDNELNRFLVTIFDDESGEIIREIPGEAMQRFARNLKEIQGLIFDEKS